MVRDQKIRDRRYVYGSTARDFLLVTRGGRSTPSFLNPPFWFISFYHIMGDYDPLEDADDEDLPPPPSAVSPMQPHAKRHRADETTSDDHAITGSCCSLPMPASGPYSEHDNHDPLISNSIISSGRRAIFVWDLDETLILFNSVLNGMFESAAGPLGKVRYGSFALCSFPVKKYRHYIS